MSFSNSAAWLEKRHAFHAMSSRIDAFCPLNSAPTSLVPEPQRPSNPIILTQTVRDFGYVTSPNQYFESQLRTAFITAGFGEYVNSATIWNSSYEIYDGTLSPLVEPISSVWSQEGNFRNEGSIVTQGGDNVIAGVYSTTVSRLSNTGDILGWSTAAGLAMGIHVMVRPFGLINSGTIAALAPTGSAYGAYFFEGANFVTNEASGQILAEGAFAVGLYFETTVYNDRNNPITNQGRIEARSTDPEIASTGVVLVNKGSGAISLVNEGVIRGDYAIYGDGGRLTITNTTSGVLDGYVSMGYGDDTIINRGVILGDVSLDRGDDVFDTAGGTVTGIIDFGLGDDRFVGSSGDDRVIGGHGSDTLDGGVGDDLLMGGWGSDRLIGGAGADGLFGEWGNDVIGTQGADFVWGGDGDDRIETSDWAFELIDGGAGFDTWVMQGATRTLDMAAVLASNSVQSIEAIELKAEQGLILRAEDIAELNDRGELLIRGSGDNLVSLVGSWSEVAPRTVSGVLYRQYQSGSATVLLQGANASVTATPPTGSGLDPLPAGNLAPLPGAETGVPLTSATTIISFLEVADGFRIEQGETWRSPSGQIVISSVYDPFGHIYNGGSIISIGVEGAPLISALGPTPLWLQNASLFTNDGLVLSQGVGSQNALGLYGSFCLVVNNGRFTTLTDLGDANGIMTSASPDPYYHGTYHTIVNNGTIEAISSRGFATAANPQNDGILNFGTVFASGATGAIAVGAAITNRYNGRNFGSTHGDIIADNRGLIQAVTTDANGAPSVGIQVGFMNSNGQATIKNSGQIIADIAIDLSGGSHELVYIYNSGEIFGDILYRTYSSVNYYLSGLMSLTNSGSIYGNIDVSDTNYYGSHQIYNSGYIEGSVSLGENGDEYRGQDGLISGTVFGNGGDDVLVGGSGADTLNGGADNDLLIGGAGNDAVNGGDGYDVAVYLGVRRAYNASALSVSGGVEDGTDTLTGIEDLAFTDGRLTFHRDGQAAQVMRLYDAAFNRSPDQSGFEAQLDTLENGSQTLQSLAQAFVDSVEFQSQYGSLNNQQFVEQMYLFCLNRAGDAEGIQGWVAAMNNGQTRAQVLLAFSESSEHKDLLQGQLDLGLWVADEQTLQIARLYDATYDRLPDQAGLRTWRDALGGGMSLETIAQTFTTAPEFQAKYGALSNQGFVELMYQLCLNRNGDPAGIQTWVDALNGGTHTRGQVLLAFSESSEHIALTRPTWLGGIPTTDLPVAGLDLDHGKDGGAQVLPAHADHGVDDGAQVVSGVDTGEAGHGAKHAETGPQVLPIVADAGADDGAQVVSGVDAGDAPQPKSVAEEGHDDALVLPGMIDDGFLLDTKGGDDFDAQILPGAGRAEHAELTDAGSDVDNLFDLDTLLTPDPLDGGGFHGSHAHGGHDLDPFDLRHVDPWGTA